MKGGELEMYINKEKVFDLMQKHFQGNYHAFARELSLDVSHLYRTLNEKNRKAGPKFLGALMQFLERNKIDYKEYIFLDTSLTVCNDSKNRETTA